MNALLDPSALGALLSVVAIDLTMAGDNAIVVGMAAAALPREMRRKVILFGIALATLLRVALALVAVALLRIAGLTLAGGIVLLWVSWKFYRDIRTERVHGTTHVREEARKHGMRNAVLRVAFADLSMSLDNVLAVAGAARAHPWIMALGLVLSVALMGAAAQGIARLLERHRWIAWIGLAIVAGVALDMIYDGTIQMMG
jgi:YjbE family integral membrane protein